LCFFVETKTKCVCCVSETKDLILAIEPACASLDHHHHPSLYLKIVKSPSWQFVLVKGVSGGGEGFIPIGDLGVQGVGDDRGKFGGLPTLAPRSYKGVCNFRPCGVKGLGTWQFKSPRVISGVAPKVLVSYRNWTLAVLALGV
ncbi:hypothetical protein Tco_1032946, partial [Tanacetum coccineum]